MNRPFLLAAITFLFTFPAPALAQLAIEPGQWTNELNATMSIDMNGQAMDLPAQVRTSSECVSPEEAVFDPASLGQDGCTYSNLRETAGSMSVDMTCDQQGVSLEGTLSVTVADDRRSLTGEMQMDGTMPGQGSMRMSGTFTGTRTGACAG